MGLFSFGKKDDEAPARRGANASSGRNARSERIERRTRRSERPADADAMMLDPTLPEKQRARRRLVGAIALVIAAVVVLPMVLDSHPKPVTDDISIDIPNRPVHEAQAANDEDTQAGVAPDNPPAETTAAASGVAPVASPPSQAATDKGSAGQVQQQAGPQAQASAQAGAKSAGPGQAARHAANQPATSSSSSSNKPAATPPKTAPSAANEVAPSPSDVDSGTPAAPPGARFAVQLGSFSDDATARSWVAKLKAAGVPAYTERGKQADGSMRTLLRAGPFADRAAASAAIAKVREAGLTANASGNAGGSGSSD